MSSPSIEELRTQAHSTAFQIRVAAVLWIMAMMIIMIAAITWLTLAVMTGDLFTNSKAVRDVASEGLLSQVGSIEAVKLWVLPFAFVGVATFLLGFGLAFANILRNIRLRGDTMAAVLPAVKQSKST